MDSNMMQSQLFACSQNRRIPQCILPTHGCASIYKAMASLGFLQMKNLYTSCRLIEMHIFGYQIRTVNMDRCHEFQISRALSFLGLREHAFLVNEKNLLVPIEFRLIGYLVDKLHI